VLRYPPITLGLGGLDLYIGPQFGRFSVGVYATLGAGSMGGEVRYRIDLGRNFSLVPFASYGYYPLVGIIGFNAGHGGRLGLEADWNTGDVARFGWTKPGTRVGLFFHAGPTFLRSLPDTAVALQGGISFGFL